MSWSAVICQSAWGRVEGTEKIRSPGCSRPLVSQDWGSGAVLRLRLRGPRGPPEEAPTCQAFFRPDWRDMLLKFLCRGNVGGDCSVSRWKLRRQEDARIGNRRRIDGRAEGCGRNVYGAMNIVKGRGGEEGERRAEERANCRERNQSVSWRGEPKNLALRINLWFALNTYCVGERRRDALRKRGAEERVDC